MTQLNLLDKVLAKLRPGSSVLFLRHESLPEDFVETIERIQSICGAENRVRLDQVDRVSIDNHQKSAYDFILSNVLTPAQESKSKQSLSLILSLLKPKGQFIELCKAADRDGKSWFNDDLINPFVID